MLMKGKNLTARDQIFWFKKQFSFVLCYFFAETFNFDQFSENKMKEILVKMNKFIATQDYVSSNA